MCGFTGFFQHRGFSRTKSQHYIEQMNSAILHRGPDGSAYWSDDDSGLVLGHTRLSILELSSAGTQPMHTADNRFHLVFNGEIYNHLALRKILLNSGMAINWSGLSDTETLLIALSVWGVEKVLHSAEGMFSFALWDSHLRRLTLARDRFGEKPLFYGYQRNGTLFFGSQPSSFQYHPDFLRKINLNALDYYFKYSYVPAPFSIYRGINKLPQGSYLTFDYTDLLNVALPDPVHYWDSIGLASSLIPRHPDSFSLHDKIDELDSVLKDAVSKCMLSDVPIGSFLSGGIDSSLITCMMQSLSNNPVNTFTIGSGSNEYDESSSAKLIAQYLGTNHTSLHVDDPHVLRVIPSLGQAYDEPFADSSQIPTLLVSELASRSVKVCLSGDGGDELFSGYNRHINAPVLWDQISRYPLAVRRAISALIFFTPPSLVSSSFSILNHFLPANKRILGFSDKYYKLQSVFSSNSSSELYQRLISVPDVYPSLLLGNRPCQDLTPCFFSDNSLSIASQIMLADTDMYLPDDILVKVDKASMFYGLEARVPFLDPYVFKFAWSLPPSFKSNRSEGKLILRSLLGRYLPSDLFQRPKMGFGLSLQSLLRGPLYSWASDLLSKSNIAKNGYLDPLIVSQIWDDHVSLRRNNQKIIWTILMWCQWCDTNL